LLLLLLLPSPAAVVVVVVVVCSQLLHALHSACFDILAQANPAGTSIAPIP
jgi:hypothetical protein